MSTLGTRIEKIIIFSLLIFALVWLSYNNLFLKFEFGQQFIYLADAFLQGQTNFRYISSYIDLVEFNGKFYWHLGPFPAVIFMPFVFLFGSNLNAGLFQFGLNVLNLILLVQIARKLNMKTINAFWLAFAYIFASMYLQVAAISVSWYFAQILTTTLVLLAIYEYLGKRHWLLIGFLTSAVLATRLHVGVSMIIFFSLAYFFNQSSSDRKHLFKLFKFLTPIILAAILLGVYNFSRFGNVFATGYGKNISNSYCQTESANTSGLAYSYSYGGILNPKFIFTNFYYYFLKGYDPVLEVDYSHILKPPFFTASPYGTGLLVSAPFFLFILLAPFREKLVRISFISSSLILLIILFWYSVNYTHCSSSIGQRFLVDLLPFWYLILIFTFRNSFPNAIKGLILASFITNFYLLNQIIS